MSIFIFILHFSSRCRRALSVIFKFGSKMCDSPSVRLSAVLPVEAGVRLIDDSHFAMSFTSINAHIITGHSVHSFRVSPPALRLSELIANTSKDIDSNVAKYIYNEVRNLTNS